MAFFHSYIERDIENGKKQATDRAETVYRDIKCPELLLWIAEASGVKDDKVKDAYDEAMKKIDKNDGRTRIAAASEIRKVINWELIESSLKSKS